MRVLKNPICAILGHTFDRKRICIYCGMIAVKP